jgi:predicted amidohydrolase
MNELKLAVVQLNSIDDVEQNVDQILKTAEELPGELDLVCLPENALYFRISKKQEMPALSLEHPQLERLQKWVDQRKTAMMIGSMPYGKPGDKKRPHNATVFLRPNEKAEVVYRKIHLFDVDVPGAPPVRESESFSYGPETAIVEWRGWRLGLSICYDLRFAELYSYYGRQNVDAILIPSSFLVPTGKAHWDILLRSRAIENQCFVVAAAQSGEHVSASGEKRHTYGHSMVVGPWGDKWIELEDDHEWGTTRLEKSALIEVRARIPMKQHRQQRNWEKGRGS